MTESEWLGCSNPHAMVEHVTKNQVGTRRSFLSWLGWRHDGKVPRKLLLFAVACCRRIDGLVVDPRSRFALDVAEKLADGNAGRKERKHAVSAAGAAAFDASGSHVGTGGWMAIAQARASEAVAAVFDEQDPANAAALAREAVRALARDPTKIGKAFLETIGFSTSPGPSEDDIWTNEAKIQCGFLRDIFDNPFQPPRTKLAELPKCRAVEMGMRVYAEHAFERLPEVAEALSAENVGTAEIVIHLKQPGKHVRGCWALDMLIGR